MRRARRAAAGDRRRLGPVRRRARRRAGRRLGALRDARRASGRPRSASPRQDAANNALLLEQLRGASDRRAALRQHAGRAAPRRRPGAADRRRPLARRDRSRAPRGSGGFGYDPLMFIPAFGKTVAELDARGQERAQPSRARGARRCCALMREALAPWLSMPPCRSPRADARPPARRRPVAERLAALHAPRHAARWPRCRRCRSTCTCRGA